MISNWWGRRSRGWTKGLNSIANLLTLQDLCILLLHFVFNIYIHATNMFFLIFTGFSKMARVTVEDCIEKIPNRYELLMVAAQRAKDLSSGAPMTVARDNDKNSVVSLREIAEGTVNIEELQKSLVMGLQKYVEVEEPEEEELEILAAEKELADLDEQFTGLLPQGELDDNMQVHGEDDVLDLDGDSEAEAPFDDEEDLGGDDTFEMGDDAGDDFDE